MAAAIISAQQFPVNLDDLPGEEWRPVVGFEEFYLVSSQGRVKSLPRGYTALRILKPYLERTGYYYVDLHADGRRARRRIHALVLESFQGPRPHGLHINHIDGNKTNNVPANLEYVTCVENIRHAYRIGLTKRPVGERAANAKLTEIAVREILSLEGVVGATQIARRFGVARASIKSVLEGRTWSHITGRNAEEKHPYRRKKYGK